jgi:phosphatidate cytidylyltransferase
VSERRLRVRVVIGALLIAAILGITIHDGGARFHLASLVAAAVGTVALAEYTRLARAAAPGRAALAFGTAALFWRTISEVLGLGGPHPGLFLVFCGIAAGAVVVASVLSRRTGAIAADDSRNLAMALLGLLLVVLPVLALAEIGYLAPSRGFPERTCTFFSAWTSSISEKNVGPWLLLVTIFACKLNDIGGYLVGSLVGRVRLAPAISPKKSVEGALAGFALGVAGSYAAFAWFCPTAGVLAPWQAVLFGVVVSVASQAGDLCESLIKRSAGVKDSGAVIPAFGGILDLVDSFILAAPAGYTLLWKWSH